MAPPVRRNDAPRVQQTAEALAQHLPPLVVAALRVAATVAQGEHGRRRVGRGDTFWQYRRYQAGDAATLIDWRQSAKTPALYVRETEWEAAQTVWLWCDHSPSMGYRSAIRLPPKRERGDLLTMALASLLVRGGERVALLGSGLAPVTGHGGLTPLALALMTGETGTGLPAPEALRRHARVVLIGDFLSPLDRIAAAIAAIQNQGGRGHLLQIVDPTEETLPFEGRVEFAGFEGEGGVLVARVEAVRETYQRRLAAHRQALSDMTARAGWTFATHRTDRPPETALLGLWRALSLEGE